ncbi:MAG: glycosyltransferase family 4 protein, partial [Oscillochloris sp.]|nr:glycosyltransferase family 4 protein [Oscillochloris sp.]
MMHICFLTVGDASRRTGGYLYHREVFARLRIAGHTIAEHAICAADPAAQQAAQAFGAHFEPQTYDVIVVDALARIVVAPWLDHWRKQRPLVAMIHELPSAAGSDSPQEWDWEAPLLRAQRIIAVSADGAATLVGRGVDRARIVVASGGFDRLPQVERPALRPDGGLRVLGVAQWIARKGLIGLAQAWAAEARPGDRLELVGEMQADPAYTAAVQQLLAAAPPESVITMARSMIPTWRR